MQLQQRAQFYEKQYNNLSARFKDDIQAKSQLGSDISNLQQNLDKERDMKKRVQEDLL